MATVKPKKPRVDNPAKKKAKKSTTSKSKKALNGSPAKAKKLINEQKAATKAYKRQATALAKSGTMAGIGANAIKKASATRRPLPPRQNQTPAQKAYVKGVQARNTLATNPKRTVTNTSRAVKQQIGSFTKQMKPLEENRLKKTPL